MSCFSVSVVAGIGAGVLATAAASSSIVAVGSEAGINITSTATNTFSTIVGPIALGRHYFDRR
jgi:hypothetical protein